MSYAAPNSRDASPGLNNLAVIMFARRLGKEEGGGAAGEDGGVSGGKGKGGEGRGRREGEEGGGGRRIKGTESEVCERC